ncbi:cohesin domain-containing protein [Paenibacillus contaminans]|uniref:Dockerin domain-containing protein n=1 Tax=Paenibacillus contaminans TaxID=450362 RepID=A0A329MFJ7_9BACL|nr:cohesin domain-containing protein [Paenibacillus contaminans]RAV17423.1 hypothetical protein DQG23_27685 [Paenibacillus contaminans]
MRRRAWRWAISMMAFLMIVFGTLTPAWADGPGSPNSKIIDGPEFLGEPLTQTLLLNTALGTEDGHNMLYTTMSGKPDAKFIVYNLDTHTAERTFELPGVKNSWSHKIDSKGNVYMLPHGYVRVYQYSPVTKQIKQSGLVPGETATYGLNIDENDNVYFGTFPSAKVIKYNPVTDEMTDFGTIFPGQKYVMSMVYHEGFLYAGGQDQNSMFVKINVETGEKTPIPNPNASELPELPAGFTPISYYMMSKVDHLVFAQIKASNGMYYMCVYDLNQGKWVKAFYRSFGHYVSPKLDGKVYLLGGLPSDGTTNALYSVDLTTFETEDTGIRYYGNYTGGGWVELQNRPDLPGKSLVTVQQGKVLAFNLAAQKAEFLQESNFPANGIHIQDLEAGPGNKLIMGGYMLDKGIIYDTETESKQEFATTQTETIKRIGNKIYLGLYTQAVLSQLDLEQPIGPANPKQLTSFGTELQDRIFDIEDADGKIVMGTFPRAGFLGGGLAIYDPATGESQLYKNVIPDQSVEGLAYKDGKVYGATSIYGGANPTQTEAKVFIFDMASRQVVKEVAPKMAGVDVPLTFIGDIEFGPDGNLWGISSGVVFALDPVTLETVKAIVVDRVSSTKTLPTVAHLIFGEDGMLYTNVNGYFTIINPFTLEYDKTSITMTYHTIASDGNIYFTGYSSDTHKLYRMKVSDLTEKSTLTAPVSTVSAETEFKVSYGVSDVSRAVYGQDINLEYDPGVIELVSARSLIEGVAIVETVKEPAGKLRLIVASQGPQHVVTGNAQVIELTFRAKDVLQTASSVISITSALLSDEQTNEVQAKASSVTITVTADGAGGRNPDINQDGKVSIGDLAFVAANYGKDRSSPDWAQVKKADINGDGRIDILDLAAVAKKILE